VVVVTALTIDPRFNGPPDSGNGGVTCGLLAHATGLDEVTLRQPPPLGKPMELRDNGLYDGDLLVASAAAGTVSITPLPAIPLSEAALATTGYAGFDHHPFPTCFVCGPEKPDGLRLFPGPISEGVVAATWVPEDDDPVMVHAALDCPSGWSHDLPGRPMVLGRMTARLDEMPRPGEDHVVLGWRVAEEGRKVSTASALYTADGAVLAVAQQTWIVLNP
jgi:hypothetical protein